MKFTGKFLFIAALLAFSAVNVPARELTGYVPRQEEGTGAGELVSRGDKCFSNGDYSSAIIFWNKAIAKNYDLTDDLDTKLAAAYGKRGNERYLKGEYCDASSDFNAALQLDPSAIDTIKDLAREKGIALSGRAIE